MAPVVLMLLPVQTCDYIPHGVDQALVLLGTANDDAVQLLHVGVDGIQSGRLSAGCRGRQHKAGSSKPSAMSQSAPPVKHSNSIKENRHYYHYYDDAAVADTDRAEGRRRSWRPGPGAGCPGAAAGGCCVLAPAPRRPLAAPLRLACSPRASAAPRCAPRTPCWSYAADASPPPVLNHRK